MTGIGAAGIGAAEIGTAGIGVGGVVWEAITAAFTSREDAITVALGSLITSKTKVMFSLNETRSPDFNACGAVIRWLLTNVPLVEPASSMK